MSSDKADGPHLKCDQYPLNTPPQYRNKKGTHSVSKAFCTRANEKHKRHSKFPVFVFFLFFFEDPSLNIWARGVLRWRLYCGPHSHTAAPHPRQCFETPREWGEERRWCRGVWFGSFRFYCDLSTYPFDQTLLWHPHCRKHTQNTMCTSDFRHNKSYVITPDQHFGDVSAPVSDTASHWQYVYMLQACRKSVEMNGFVLPVCFAEVLEVVHVAASGGVLSVFSLSLFGVSDVQQVSVVLHHVLAFLETPSSKYCSPFSLDMLHLRKYRRTEHEHDDSAINFLHS